MNGWGMPAPVCQSAVHFLRTIVERHPDREIMSRAYSLFLDRKDSIALALYLEVGGPLERHFNAVSTLL